MTPPRGPPLPAIPLWAGWVHHLQRLEGGQSRKPTLPKWVGRNHSHELTVVRRDLGKFPFNEFLPVPKMVIPWSSGLSS